MSDQPITVSLYGETVGYLAVEGAGKISFEYEPSFVNSGLQISPKHLPLENRIFSFPELSRTPGFEGLPGVFADSLPDSYGSKVIEEFFKKRGILPTDITPFARLLYVGRRGMGALEYEPEEDLKLKSGEDYDIATLWQKSRNVIEGRVEDDTDGIFRYGGSAGGARAKAVILFNPDTREFKTPGKTFGTIADVKDGFSNWVLKFDGIIPEKPELDEPQAWERIEYIYNIMAKRADIDVPPVDFVEENGRFHFLVKRFDRDEGRRIHMHTLGGLLHKTHHDQQAVDYSVFFATLQNLTQDAVEMREAFRRMVFNVLAQNLDDHVKNISFLMAEDGAWRLSPAYDLVWCSLKHPTFARGHQMTVAGRALEITGTVMKDLAKQYSITKPNEIIEEVIEVLSGFEDLAKKYGVKELFIDKYNQVSQALVETRELADQ